MEEVTGDEMNLKIWKESESESDAEFHKDDGMAEEIMPTPEDNTTNIIDCYRHFTDDIISLIIRETSQYAD